MLLRDDIHRIGKLIASVNELVKMGLLQKFTDEPIVYVHPACLQTKDKKYMTNWCRNVLRIWQINYAAKILEMESNLEPGEILKIELSVFSQENTDYICRYSEVDGLSYS